MNMRCLIGGLHYSKKKGFELRVLFDCPPLKTFRIIAENVVIEVVK